MMDTKEIPLTHGHVALVDAVDYELLAQFGWYAAIRRDRDGAVYARRSVRQPNGRYITEHMHRVLLPSAELVDHINGNGLDNRRANLRAATNAQNMRNRRRLAANNTSGYRGVSWHKQTRKWRALIIVDGRRIHLGGFEDAADGARAFDAAAVELHGEFHGYLNFPEAVQR